MKIVKESLKIFESPDEISMPHLTYNKYGEPLENDIFKSPHFSDDDAHAFWYDEGSFHIGPAGETHPEGTRNPGMLSGRIWTDKKLISFWKYPDKETFFEAIDLLSDKLGEDMSNWKVEVLDKNSWRQDDNYQSRLIPVADYEGSEDRSELEMGKEHIKSPLLKTKHVPYGYGSKNPKYQDQRKWQMASLTSESMNFERGKDPKDSMGIGNKKIREIRSDYKYLEPIINSLEPPDDEFTFQKVRLKIDGMKRVIELVIMEFIRQKYGIIFQEDSQESRFTSSNLFASATVGEYRYELLRNGVGSTYWAKVISLKGNILNATKTTEEDFIETSQSTSLRIFDEKFQKLLKKYH
ncbi:MAG TPA: hypothetical protein PK122_05090 [Candidatus Paceibacterota bacterium]|nr:hypothetical protein [Candidatus Paceibacterota bacterium]